MSHLELQILFSLCCLGETLGLRMLRCLWSVWPGAHMASRHRQWDCCPKLFTLKIVLQCVSGSDSYMIHTYKKILSITAATTNVRWAVSTPKGAVWTPVITCLRSSGTLAARWSLSTSRPQVLQYTCDPWPHIYSFHYTQYILHMLYTIAYLHLNKISLTQAGSMKWAY